MLLASAFQLPHCLPSLHCASPSPLCSLEKWLWIAARTPFYHLFIGLTNPIPSSCASAPFPAGLCWTALSVEISTLIREPQTGHSIQIWYPRCQREGKDPFPGAAHNTLANAACGGSPLMRGLTDNHAQLVEYKDVQAFFLQNYFLASLPPASSGAWEYPSYSFPCAELNICQCWFSWGSCLLISLNWQDPFDWQPGTLPHPPLDAG